MKKVFLLITVLFVSVISTACINNLAVQELNSKAKAYMEAGDTDKAICRLRSSIDLDTNVFESHYNLGVALISAKQYDEAEKSLQNAIKLKPEVADTYYSMAVVLEEQAFEEINPSAEDKVSEEKQEVQETAEEESPAKLANVKKELTDEDKTEIVEKLNSAIENYNTYLAKKPDAQDKEKVTSQIDYLSEQIKKYTPEQAVTE